MPGDNSTLASKSTDRCVNPTTDAFVSVSHLLVSTRFSVLNLSLSFLLSPSTGSSSTPFFFSPGYHRSSLTVCTVPDLVRSEERSDPGDRRVVTVIPQKDSDARLLSSMRLSSSRSFPHFSPLSFCVLIALIRTVSLRPRVSDGRVDFHEQIDRDETGTVSGHH